MSDPKMTAPDAQGERMVLAYMPEEDRSMRLMVRGRVDEDTLNALEFWIKVRRKRLREAVDQSASLSLPAAADER